MIGVVGMFRRRRRRRNPTRVVAGGPVTIVGGDVPGGPSNTVTASGSTPTTPTTPTTTTLYPFYWWHWYSAVFNWGHIRWLPGVGYVWLYWTRRGPRYVPLY